ncbi:hypothetical protein TNCV_3647001 [Trichonephila clavipes]|nr:hypothetical protein TNCV_3647001 [Trichonephila clavipes]
MLDSETATHIGVLQGEEWYKPRDLGKQCDTFYASKGKSYDEPERAKWNDSEREVLMVVGDEEVTAEMDKGIMVADSFRSEQECCAEFILVWKYAKGRKRKLLQK